MGKIKQGILGGFSGKVGSVVGGTWKGISFMRGLAASVSNPQTAPQMSQRQKFSVTMGFLQPLALFLKTGFKEYAVRKTGINAAMGYNIRNAITGSYPNYAIEYQNALVSRGALPAALNAAVASTVAGTVHFTWDDNSDESGADASDQTLLVVYNALRHQVISAEKLATRATATQNVTVPGVFSGDLVHCYMSYITADGKELSSSRYAGSVTVA